MHWYIHVLKEYATFSGRATRAEYWQFLLVHILVSMGLGVVDAFLLDPPFPVGDQGVLNGLYSLATILPSLAVAVRRLHDTGRTGWWLLIGLIPAVGLLVLLVFFVIDSEPNENSYGPNPKSEVA